MHKCKKCDKSFKSEPALRGHRRVHSKGYKQSQEKHTIRLRKIAINKVKQNKNNYYNNPIYCLNCDNVIPYEKIIKGTNKFCNHSCAASYTNKLKPPKSQETRIKISTGLKKYNSTIQKKKKILPQRTLNTNSLKYFKNSIAGKYSKIYNRTCAHCKRKFISRQAVKYCKEHSTLYKRNNRNRYAFTFSLSKYPDLFGHMSQQLKDVGIWSYENKQGLTRDHKISVNESIRNNYDPYYIKHPLNCELMSWHDNNKKKTKSSLTYIDLKKLVDEYDLSTNCLAPPEGFEPS